MYSFSTLEIWTCHYNDYLFHRILKGQPYRAQLAWASLVAQLVKNLPAMQETLVLSWVREIHWRRDRLPTPVFLGFPGGSAGKESVCNAGDLGLIPESGRSLGEGKDYPFQYSGLENSMEYIVHGVAKSRTQLSDFHCLLYGPALTSYTTTGKP